MSDNERVREGGLRIARVFHHFVEHELLPEIGFKSDEFWQGLEAIVASLTPTNRALLARRDELQEAIDKWHDGRPGSDWSHDEYVDFLKSIGYLQDAGEPFSIETENVDAEIAETAGPQLVVPVSNARFAVNAVRRTGRAVLVVTTPRAVPRLFAMQPRFWIVQFRSQTSVTRTLIRTALIDPVAATRLLPLWPTAIRYSSAMQRSSWGSRRRVINRPTCLEITACILKFRSTRSIPLAGTRPRMSPTSFSSPR